MVEKWLDEQKFGAGDLGSPPGSWLSLISYATLGKLLHPSKSQLSYLKNEKLT